MKGSIAALLTLLASAVLFAQADALLEQADAAFREGNFNRSVLLARRVLAQNPNAVHAHMILGIIAAQKKEWTTSNRHFTAIVRLEPSNPYGYFYLGQAKLYQQQWASAVDYFSKAMKRDYPDKARLLTELALAQQEAGRPEEAIASLAGVDPPADPALAAQYYAVVAFAREKLGEPSAAIEAIQHALQSDDSNAHYWEFLITTLIKIDEAPHALAEAIRAQKKFPDEPNIQYAFALASYHVTESPLSKLALRNLREADPKDPRALFAEGLLARKQVRMKRPSMPLSGPRCEVFRMLTCFSESFTRKVGIMTLRSANIVRLRVSTHLTVRSCSSLASCYSLEENWRKHEPGSRRRTSSCRTRRRSTISLVIYTAAWAIQRNHNIISARSNSRMGEPGSSLHAVVTAASGERQM
jgi:tetratricopeptide (TPR) repeat protein